MRHSFREISTFMNSVEQPASIAELIRIHTTPNDGFRAIVDRHTHERKKELRFLFLNTLLLEVGGDVATTKPATDARSAEIGRMVRDRYDIATLAEVFREEEKDRILEQWDKDSPPFSADKIHRVTRRSGGLLTISQAHAIESEQTYEYKFESGIDKRADKGVLLARIDVGFSPSTLDVYLTHLNAGNNFTQRMQLIELANFVAETRNESNPMLIVGDFNMAAYKDEEESLVERTEIFPSSREKGKKFKNRIEPSPFYQALINHSNEKLSEYDILKTVMGELKCIDLWQDRAGSEAYGYTSKMDGTGVAERICPMDSEGYFYRDNHVAVSYCSEENQEPPPFFYEEIRKITGTLYPAGGLTVTETKRSDRIDYMFYTPSTESSSFNIDFTRPRRLRMERKGKDYGWLSDHIGLETTLLISPR